MSPFVEDGFVADDYVGEESVAGLPVVTPYVVQTQFSTDCREYRRGRFPDDWQWLWDKGKHRIEGVYCDLADRNYIRLQGNDARTAIIWKGVPNYTAVNDPEELFRFRILSQGSDRNLGLIRASGAKGAENGYYLKPGIINGLTVGKLVAGVATDLVVFPFTFKIHGFYNARFRAQGTQIRAKIWADGDVEPAWQITTTDSSLTTGGIGLTWVLSNEIAEVHYFSCATGGNTALDESSMDEPLSLWIKEPDETMEITARFEYYNPDTDQVESRWVSTHSRETGSTDYPPNTSMISLGEGENLGDLGIIASRLEVDAFLSGAALPTRNQIRIPNRATTPGGQGPLSDWSRYSFYGRPVEIRAGKRWRIKPGTNGNSEGILTPHRRFELLGCALPTQEPNVEEEITMSLGPPTTFLASEVSVKRNIGIATGVKSLTNTGYVSIPSNIAYDIASYVVYFRILVPVAGVPGTSYGVASRRYHLTSTLWQWEAIILNASWSTVADRNKLVFRAHANDGTLLLSSVASPALNDDTYHDIIMGLSNLSGWYLNVDGEHISGGPAPKVVNIGNSPVQVNYLLPGCSIVDHRIESYVSEEEAVARFATRREPDVITVSMHRMDDNSASTVTDYASLGNHGTLTGTNNVDRIWTPTYLGGPELTGVPMPFSGGVLFHGPTQNIDPLRSIHRYNDKGRTPGVDLGIRVKGALIPPIDYVEPVEGKGSADLLSSDQPVTFQLPPEPFSLQAQETHVPILARDELINRKALSVETCDVESFAGLRRVLPLAGGFYYKEPPDVNKYLADMLGPIGAYYGLDRDSRVYGNCILPTINPGPYGISNLLEFGGLTDQGVTLSDITAYQLTQTAADFGLLFWFKLSKKFTPDLSVTATGDYSQPGYTIIDKMAGGTTGYYAGLDGNTGALRFAAGGIDFGGGTHYATIGNYSSWKPGVWHAASLSVQSGIGWLQVQTLTNGISRIVADALIPGVTGTLTPSPGIPLRIGHGPMGSFVGSICYAYGLSPAQDPPSYSPLQTPIVSPGSPITPGGTTRFLLSLTDGNGDRVYDSSQGRYGRIHGCRWSPELVLDFERSLSDVQLKGPKRGIPARKIETRYKVNHQRLGSTDVVAGVSPSDRTSLNEPYLSDFAPRDLRMKSKYINSKEEKFTSPIFSQVSAQEVTNLLNYRLSVERRLGSVMGMDRRLLKLNIGDEVVIYHPEPYFANGRAMRVTMLTMGLPGLGIGEIGFWGGEDEKELVFVAS